MVLNVVLNVYRKFSQKTMKGYMLNTRPFIFFFFLKKRNKSRISSNFIKVLFFPLNKTMFLLRELAFFKVTSSTCGIFFFFSFNYRRGYSLFFYNIVNQNLQISKITDVIFSNNHVCFIRIFSKISKNTWIIVFVL